MEQRINKIAFFGSPYELELFKSGIINPDIQIKQITELPLKNPADLLVIGHQPPEHDGNKILGLKNISNNVKSIVLLAHGAFPLEGYPSPENPQSDAFNFRWVTDTSLSGSIVRLAQNHINADFYYQNQHRRFLLLVEDEITYASYFIPLILNEMELRTKSLLTSHDKARLKQKTKNEHPVLLMASSYEKASFFLDKYGDRTVGVISSLGFLKNGKHKWNAGLALAEKVKSMSIEIPVVIQTKNIEMKEEIIKSQAAFLRKNSPDLLKLLRIHLLEHFGFGDFIFRLPDDPESEIARAADLVELKQCLDWVPDESFVYHAEKYHFSNWLGVHGYLDVAEKIRPIKAINIKETRKALISHLNKLI